MAMGRKPKPYAVKVAEGNRGRRKLTPSADLPAGPFEAPFLLEGVGRQEWERILQVAFWLRESEAAAIADRCLCFQRMLEAEEDITKRGSVVRTRNGKVKNPSIQIAREYRSALQKHDAELGLTASSRTRVSVGGPGSSAGSGNSARSGEPIDPMEAALCGQLPN